MNVPSGAGRFALKEMSKFENDGSNSLVLFECLICFLIFKPWMSLVNHLVIVIICRCQRESDFVNDGSIKHYVGAS